VILLEGAEPPFHGEFSMLRDRKVNPDTGFDHHYVASNLTELLPTSLLESLHCIFP
jgi:hypothetical protein